MCLLYCSALCWPVRHTALIPTNVEVRICSHSSRKDKKKLRIKTQWSCIYLTDYWVMWEVLLCTVSTVTLSEIRLLKKKKITKKSLLFDITPYNNSIYKRFHLLHKSSRTKQQITNYTRQRTNKYLYISRVVCFVSKEKLV